MWNSSTKYAALGLALCGSLMYIVRSRKIEVIKALRKNTNSAEDLLWEDDVCDDEFGMACMAVSTEAKRLSGEQQLRFYGLYKQAIVGDCQAKEPSVIFHVEREKWRSWKHCKGMTRVEAENAYVRYAKELNILEDLDTRNGLRHIVGQVVSCLQQYTSEPIPTSAADLFCGLGARGDLMAIREKLAGDPSLVRCANTEGMTALHFAADRGYKEVVQLLIQRGADVNCQDDCGETPLHVAAIAQRTDIIDILVGSGADMEVKNNEGFTARALMQADS